VSALGLVSWAGRRAAMTPQTSERRCLFMALGFPRGGVAGAAMGFREQTIGKKGT
jgi:hypothetical protein